MGTMGNMWFSPEQRGNPQSEAKSPRATRKSPERSGYPQSEAAIPKATRLSPEQRGNPQSEAAIPRATRKSPEQRGNPQSNSEIPCCTAGITVSKAHSGDSGDYRALYTAKKIGASRLGSSEKVWFNNQEFDYI